MFSFKRWRLPKIWVLYGLEAFFSTRIILTEQSGRISVPVSIGDVGKQFNWPKDMYAETIKKEVIPPGATGVITAKALSSSDGKTPDADAAISVPVEGNHHGYAGLAFCIV